MRVWSDRAASRELPCLLLIRVPTPGSYMVAWVPPVVTLSIDPRISPEHHGCGPSQTQRKFMGQRIGEADIR